MNRDYFQDALMTFNGGNWWGWKTHDSNGDKIPVRVKKLVKRIQTQAKELGFELEFHQNHPKEHQKGDTECGMYSLYLIIQMLTDKKSPEYYMKHRVSDDEMEKLRKKYFNWI